MEKWLRSEPHGKSLCYFIIACVIVILAYDFLYSVITIMLNATQSEPENIHKKGIQIFTFYFPFLIFLFALIEEMTFRMPLAILVHKNKPVKTILTFAVFFSVIFGFLHGGIEHIFMQGVAGMVFSIAFLKCGGLQKKHVKALLTSTTIHYLCNAILFTLAALAGATSI